MRQPIKFKNYHGDTDYLSVEELEAVERSGNYSPQTIWKVPTLSELLRSADYRPNKSEPGTRPPEAVKCHCRPNHKPEAVHVLDGNDEPVVFHLTSKTKLWPNTACHKKTANKNDVFGMKMFSTMLLNPDSCPACVKIFELYQKQALRMKVNAILGSQKRA